MHFFWNHFFFPWFLLPFLALWVHRHIILTGTNLWFFMLHSKGLPGCCSPYFLQWAICICTKCQMSSLVTVLRNGHYPSLLYSFQFRMLSYRHLKMRAHFIYLLKMKITSIHMKTFVIDGILNDIAALFTVGKLVYDILLSPHIVK